MKTQKKYSKEGFRLSILLGLRFKTQVLAAEYFEVGQSSISGWLKRERFSAWWLKTYGPKLKDLGLNPAYLTDPAAPMEVDFVRLEIEAAQARLIELQSKIREYESA